MVVWQSVWYQHKCDESERRKRERERSGTTHTSANVTNCSYITIRKKFAGERWIEKTAGHDNFRLPVVHDEQHTNDRKTLCFENIPHVLQLCYHLYYRFNL